MQSNVLERLKAKMDKKATVEFNPEFAKKKYYDTARNVMDCSFNVAVHDYFFSTYVTKFDKEIRKAVLRIKELNSELIATAFISKLALKLPLPNVPNWGSDMHSVQASHIIAACITHILMDTEIFNYKREVKRVGPKQWQTITTLFLGGDDVKDIAKGIHFKAGQFYQKATAAGKLNAEQKGFAKELASIPLEVSDVVTKELLMFGYSLKKDWNKRTDKNGRALPEHFNTKKERYERYADCVMGLKDETIYLEMKYSDSGRMFYKCQLEGIRPQGKLWETLLIDSAKPYYMTVSQLDALKHHIYCAIEDVRVPVSEAVENFTDEHYIEAISKDFYDVDMDNLKDREEEFGTNILLKKAALAIKDTLDGKPTKYMFGWDFTTSGLIVAGVSFHSKHMMDAGNMHTGTVVNDSHTNFNNMLDLGMERKDAKKLHQPLLHGGTFKGLLKKVHEIKEDDSLQFGELIERLENAYGKCVHNIEGLADWGTQAVSNNQSKLHWTVPDGYKATHKAYYVSVHSKVVTVSCDPEHKNGITSHTIISDLPYATDNLGNSLAMPSVDVDGNPVKAEVKVRGLYATITHSLDSFVLRYIAGVFMSYGFPIKLKHDDFAIHPSHYELLLNSAREAFEVLAETNFYQEAVNEIAEYSDQSGISAPKLLTLDHEAPIAEAECFLMP